MKCKKFLEYVYFWVQLNTQYFAFSNNPLYGHPLIKSTMSGRRFEQLLNCFSVKYSGIKLCDDGPMQKINAVYKLLIENFQKAIYPDINLSLDEYLLLHRGRLAFRQYIKEKKAKYGIKFLRALYPRWLSIKY